MKTCLLVLLMTGSWWLCMTIVAIEETQAEQRNRKEGSLSGMPAKSPRPVEGRQKQAETKTLSSVKPAVGRKPHRVIKSSKKVPRKILVAQPRTDLIHYGVLEDSQRYDPRPHAHAAGVPHPQTPDLTHDHFQELDRNQDGKIDPVERAFGRIDMDRDLNTRTFR
jgi:hypothetical protein